jgi:poly-gamma-glutamate synthesis protein (capsule biosynthesis protein)
LSVFFILVPAVTLHAADVTVVAVGDVYLGSRAVPFIERNGVDYPFDATREILGEGDLVIGNLESPLTDYHDRFMEKKFILKASPGSAEGIRNAPIDVVTLANNHIMDYGGRGLKDTTSVLDRYGILHTGAGENLAEARSPALYEVQGVKIAVLAYSKTFPTEFYAKRGSSGTAPGYARFVSKDVMAARARADIVIVAFHWGGERLITPKHYQVELAHLAVESGAQLVIGHHPHVVQGIEEYKGGLIFYSLGNFVFGFYSSPNTEGVVAKVVFEETGDGHRVKSAGVIPLDVDNRKVRFNPAPLEGERAARMLKEIERRSELFYSRFRREGSPAHGLVLGSFGPP